MRSWWFNFYWTSIFFVFKQLREERIKNCSYNHMLYKTVAKLLYKLRCEDDYTQVNPTKLCHSPDLTSNTTREPPANSLLQSIQWKDQPSLQHMITCTANTSKKAMDNQLQQKRKPTLKKVQQQHPQVMQFLKIKPHIHLSHILEWWYPILKAQKWPGL